MAPEVFTGPERKTERVNKSKKAHLQTHTDVIDGQISLRVQGAELETAVVAVIPH